MKCAFLFFFSLTEFICKQLSVFEAPMCFLSGLFIVHWSCGFLLLVYLEGLVLPYLHNPNACSSVSLSLVLMWPGPLGAHYFRLRVQAAAQDKAALLSWFCPNLAENKDRYSEIKTASQKTNHAGIESRSQDRHETEELCGDVRFNCGLFLCCYSQITVFICDRLSLSVCICLSGI